MKAFDLIKPFFKSHKGVVALGLFSLITVDALQLMIPRIIKWAVDDLTLYRADAAALLGYAGAVLIMAVLIGGLIMMNTLFMSERTSGMKGTFPSITIEHLTPIASITTLFSLKTSLRSVAMETLRLFPLLVLKWPRIFSISSRCRSRLCLMIARATSILVLSPFEEAILNK